MASFGGQIQKGGQVILADVTGNIWYQAGSWGGTFTLPAGQHIDPGGPYRLVLDDGRSGDIDIGASSTASGQPTIVFFSGLGPAPVGPIP